LPSRIGISNAMMMDCSLPAAPSSSFTPMGAESSHMRELRLIAGM
jgi:hypothetical protein